MEAGHDNDDDGSHVEQVPGLTHADQVAIAEALQAGIDEVEKQTRLGFSEYPAEYQQDNQHEQEVGFDQQNEFGKQDYQQAQQHGFQDGGQHEFRLEQLQHEQDERMHQVWQHGFPQIDDFHHEEGQFHLNAIGQQLHDHTEISIDPQLQLLDTSAEHTEGADQAGEHRQSEALPQNGQTTTVTLAEGENPLADVNLNELIMGMDLSDPVAAIAQLQSATNIDPEILLQAITSALSSILGDDEGYEVTEAQTLTGEDGLPRSKRRRTRVRVPPKTAEDHMKLQLTNRRRKQRWRQRNDERNKDNDLRARLNRRADHIYGKEPSAMKTEWVQTEFVKRRERRIRRMENVFNPADALGSLFGQVGAGEELQAALAEIMGRDGDIEKFNTTLLQLARDPDLIKNLTSMMQQMGDGEGASEEALDKARILTLPEDAVPEEGAEMSPDHSLLSVAQAFSHSASIHQDLSAAPDPSHVLQDPKPSEPTATPPASIPPPKASSHLAGSFQQVVPPRPLAYSLSASRTSPPMTGSPVHSQELDDRNKKVKALGFPPKLVLPLFNPSGSGSEK